MAAKEVQINECRKQSDQPGSPPTGIREWTPDKDVWELYNVEDDWSQANDLATKMREKLAQARRTAQHHDDAQW